MRREAIVGVVNFSPKRYDHKYHYTGDFRHIFYKDAGRIQFLFSNDHDHFIGEELDMDYYMGREDSKWKDLVIKLLTDLQFDYAMEDMLCEK